MLVLNCIFIGHLNKNIFGYLRCGPKLQKLVCLLKFKKLYFVFFQFVLKMSWIFGELFGTLY